MVEQNPCDQSHTPRLALRFPGLHGAPAAIASPNATAAPKGRLIRCTVPERTARALAFNIAGLLDASSDAGKAHHVGLGRSDAEIANHRNRRLLRAPRAARPPRPRFTKSRAAERRAARAARARGPACARS